MQLATRGLQVEATAGKCPAETEAAKSSTLSLREAAANPLAGLKHSVLSGPRVGFCFHRL